MRLYAFRGTRYADGGGALAAPPFDQIDARRQARLHAAHACQFAHLTRPRSPADAARLLADWAADGTLARDDAPCLYAYEIRLADGGRRLGLCGLVGLEDPANGVIRPHESTVAKTVDERLDLLDATRTDLEPILMLCQRSDEFEALLGRAVGADESLASHTDEFGHKHRLFRIADRATCERFKQILAASPGWIADGHHRYRVASEFARRHAPAAGTPAAAKLAVITSLASPGLQIDPIHRALGVGVDLETAGNAVVARSEWHPGGNGKRGGAGLATAVASAPQPAVGVWRHGGEPEIWRLDPASAPTGWPEPATALAAALLHTTLFERFGLGPGASHDGTTTYRSDPDQLWDEVEGGQAAVGFWLPPTSPELFAGAVAAGDRLPPKWTRFVPKLVSGLVWCSHDAEIA